MKPARCCLNSFEGTSQKEPTGISWKAPLAHFLHMLSLVQKHHLGSSSSNSCDCIKRNGGLEMILLPTLLFILSKRDCMNVWALEFWWFLLFFYWLSLFKKENFSILGWLWFFRSCCSFNTLRKSSGFLYWRSWVRIQANQSFWRILDLKKLFVKKSSHPSFYCQLRGKRRDPSGGLITLCQKSGSLTKWDRMAAILSSPPLVKLKKGKLYIEYIGLCYSLSKTPFGEAEGLDVHHHTR